MPYTPPVGQGPGLSPNTVVLTQNGYMSQAAFMAYNTLKPFEMLNLFLRNESELKFRTLLRGMGFRRVVGSPTTGHYEVGKLIDNITIGSIVSGGATAGADIVVALDATNMFAVTVGATTYNTSFPSTMEIWETAGGVQFQVVSKNTSTNPNQLTLRPSLTTTVANTILTGGTVMIWRYSDYAEGMETAQGKGSRVTKYTNSFVEPKDSYSTTERGQATVPYWQPLPGVTGAYTLRLEDEMWERYQQQIDNALIFGKQSNNLSNTNTTIGITTPITGTQGMIDYITTYGWNLPIVGSRSIQDFYDVTNTFEGERVHSKEYFTLAGYQAVQEYEQVFADFGDAYYKPGYTLVSEDGDGMKIELGASSIKLGGGYNFKLQSFGAFNDNLGSGTPGFPWPGVTAHVPVGYMTDKKTSTNKPISGYEVMGDEGRYEVEDKISSVDGTGKYSSIGGTTQAIYRMGIMSVICWHGTCPNNTAIQYNNQ